MNTRLIGLKGENAAVKFLKKKGYKIICRNYRCKFGEIDVIAGDKNYIVFIEVKSRSDDGFGLPREAVTDGKRKTITACAVQWLAANGKTGFPVRFDVVEILRGEITLLQDAFRP